MPGVSQGVTRTPWTGASTGVRRLSRVHEANGHVKGIKQGEGRGHGHHVRLTSRGTAGVDVGVWAWAYGRVCVCMCEGTCRWSD